MGAIDKVFENSGGVFDQVTKNIFDKPIISKKDKNSEVLEKIHQKIEHQLKLQQQNNKLLEKNKSTNKAENKSLEK